MLLDGAMLTLVTRHHSDFLQEPSLIRALVGTKEPVPLPLDALVAPGAPPPSLPLPHSFIKFMDSRALASKYPGGAGPRDLAVYVGAFATFAAQYAIILEYARHRHPSLLEAAQIPLSRPGAGQLRGTPPGRPAISLKKNSPAARALPSTKGKQAARPSGDEAFWGDQLPPQQVAQQAVKGAVWFKMTQPPRGGPRKSRSSRQCPMGFPPGWVKETKETACHECGQLDVKRDFGCLYSDTDLYEREGHRLAIVSMYDNIDPALSGITRPNKQRYDPWVCRGFDFLYMIFFL
jgi:hypothetical protein